LPAYTPPPTNSRSMPDNASVGSSGFATTPDLRAMASATLHVLPPRD